MGRRFLALGDVFVGRRLLAGKGYTGEVALHKVVAATAADGHDVFTGTGGNTCAIRRVTAWEKE